jgi:hypothetical protein
MLSETAVDTSEWCLLLSLRYSLDLHRLRLSLIAVSLIMKSSSLLKSYRVHSVIFSEDVLSVPSLKMITYKTGSAETVVRDWNDKFLYQKSQDS